MDRRGGAPDQEKRALEAYFSEHQIQEKLNRMLNDMVQVRPHMPYSWLAQRMRRDGCSPSPAVGTVPIIPAAAKNTFASEMEKTWGYVLGLQARGKGGAQKVQTNKRTTGASNAPMGVQLTIEPLGNNVLLAIRSN